MNNQMKSVIIAVVLCLLSFGGVLYSREIRGFESEEINVIAGEAVLPEGFKELRASNNVLTGTYEFEDTSITFETRRGPLTPKILRFNEDTPLYEVDVRFLDADGTPFLIQVGGHAPIDKSWNEAGISENHPISGKARRAQVQAQLEASVKAIEAMKNSKINRRLAPEYKALIDLLPFIKSLGAIDRIEEDHVGALNKSGCSYRHRVEIHDQPCCLGFGRHSATITRNIDAYGTTTSALVTCNHGDCATVMPLYCQWTTALDRCPLYSTIKCTTEYEADSVGGHNCNDDTYIQYQRIREAVTPNPSLGTCYDSYSRMTTPACY